jgi:signal transduction histidine kinase
MKLWHKALFMVIQILAACSHAASIREVPLGSAPAETMLLPHLQVAAQPANNSQNWGPQEAWEAVMQGQILRLNEKRKPYRSALVHWAVTRLTHQSSETDWVIYYRLAAMENMQVFTRVGGGDWLPLKGLHHQTQFLTGYHFPSFALRMPRGEIVDLAVRVQTRAPIDMHILAVPGYHFYEAQRSDLVISGMVVAVPLVVLLYLVLLLPKTSHLGLGWFIAMIVLETMGSMWISGHGQVLLPMIDRKDWPAIGYISYSLLVLVSWLHGQRFVAAAPLSLGVRVFGWSVVAVVASCTAVELLGWANVRDVIPAGLLIFSCLMTLVGLRAMRNGIAYAGYYTLAWLAFVAPAVVLAFNLLGILSMSGSNIYFVQSSVAAILFGLVAVGHIRAREQVLTQAQQERQQLSQTKDQLEEALAVRLRFFAATNHDLRQPLQAMSIYLDLAMQQALEQASDKLRVYLSEAKAANSSVSHFLDSLMDLARIESKVLNAQPVPMNLVPMLIKLVREHQPLAGRVGLELRYFLPDRAYTQTDPRLLERIVRNLLSNAIRYTREGGVLLALRKSSDQWKLQIYDTGVGFRDSDMERLFQPFSSTDEHQAQFHTSSGLGLFVVKSFAEALGHATQLKTQQGKGSCFSLMLPKLKPVDGATDPMLQKRFEDGLAGLAIWVLDDERDVGEALLAMMQDAGAEVTLFQSPQQIDAAIANTQRRPQMLLADFNLGQSGLLTEHLDRWQQSLACPIVALTGSMRIEIQQALLASGVQEVLAKPVSIDALTQAVNRALHATSK